MSWTKTSTAAFVSPGTRFDELLEKTTYLLSAEIEGWEERPFPSTPFESTLASPVVPVERSWKKTFREWIVPPGTRFVAELLKTTTRPSAEIEE
jgi:hypothetical protein